MQLLNYRGNYRQQVSISLIIYSSRTQLNKNIRNSDKQNALYSYDEISLQNYHEKWESCVQIILPVINFTSGRVGITNNRFRRKQVARISNFPTKISHLTTDVMSQKLCFAVSWYVLFCYTTVQCCQGRRTITDMCYYYVYTCPRLQIIIHAIGCSFQY